MRAITRLWPAAMLAVVSILTTDGHAARKPKPAPAHPGPPRAEIPDEANEPGLDMSKAIACASIDGYEKFEALPDAALTSDEKLLVYYRPLNYHTEKAGATKHIHLVQDGQIRRRGEKAILMSKAKMIDYEWKSTEPELPVFLRNTVGLKG